MDMNSIRDYLTQERARHQDANPDVFGDAMYHWGEVDTPEQLVNRLRLARRAVWNARNAYTTRERNAALDCYDQIINWIKAQQE